MKIDFNIKFNYVPVGIPVVYCLVKNEKIQYIGQTTNILTRLATHSRSKNIPFDSVKYVECEIYNLLPAEKELIKKYNPPYNRVWNEKYDRENIKINRETPLLDNLKKKACEQAGCSINEYHLNSYRSNRARRLYTAMIKQEFNKSYNKAVKLASKQNNKASQ